MQEEFKSLQDNETWEFVPLPSKRKLVQCKWVYRTKMDSIMLVLDIVASKRWEVHHMDVKSDFLPGDLHEDIYM